MDPNIRPKTPYEVAGELRREQAADSRHRALKAMAGALSEIGYTRDNEATEVTGPNAMYATAHMMKSLLESGDDSFLWEFISEPGGRGTDRCLFGLIIDHMIAPAPERARLVGETIPTLCRWYGESFLQEALDMLDSASEIERDRKVDQDIKARKESVA